MQANSYLFRYLQFIRLTVSIKKEGVSKCRHILFVGWIGYWLDNFSQTVKSQE